MNGKWISKSVLIVFSMAILSTAAVAQSRARVNLKQRFSSPAAGAAAAAPDAARDLFNAGQKSYDEDRYTEAERTFRQVVQRYPKNSIADKAEYYLIRTLAQLGKRNEALSHVNQFAAAYPQSKWSTDVEEMRIRLTNRITPQAIRTLQVRPGVVPGAPTPEVFLTGVPPNPPDPPAAPPRPFASVRTGFNFNFGPFGPQDQQSSDPEISLQQELLRALFNSDFLRAIGIATERLKNNPADPVVLSNLNMLASSSVAQALPMLVSIAKNSTNTKARKDAIFWISQSRSDKGMVVDTLVSLLPAIADDESDAVAYALGQTRNDKAIDALATIARDKNKSEKTRNNAIYWISNSKWYAKRTPLLEDVYKNSMDNSKVRLQVLFALSQVRDGQSVTMLGNIAGTDPDIEVKKQAVFWLGQSRTVEAREALENLLRKK